MATEQGQIPTRGEPPESSQAFFAALLQANRGDCDCKTCQILRKMGDDMTSQFLEGE